MDLTTRCPKCGATFSVGLEQLQLRKGYIRCPNCAYIFDGFEAVVPSGTPVSPEAAEPAPAAPAVPHVVRQRVAPGARIDPGLTAAWPADDRSEPRVTMRPGRVEPQGDTPFVPDSRAQAPSSSGPREPAPFVAEPRLEVPPPPEPHVGGVVEYDTGHRADAAPAPRERREGVYADPRPGGFQEAVGPDFLDAVPRRYRGFAFYVWGFLSMVGLAVLLAQCFYVYRAQLAADLPAIRPLLEQACLSLRCQVPYSREIGDITIMNSSLQTRVAANKAPPAGQATANEPSAPQGAGTAMVLHVTLRNSFDKPQEWPTLMLDLLDFSGTVVVKKDLPPASYLPPDILSHAFAAHSEVTATIPITMDGVTVSGFQLTKYFS